MAKTLIILTPGFPKDEEDTTCLPSQQSLIKNINALFPNLEIVILSFQYPFSKISYKWNNNTVIPFNGKNKGHLARRFLWLKVWQKLKQIYKEEDVIGIFSFWLDECAFIGNRFAKNYNMLHYCWILGQDARIGNKYVKKFNTNGENLVALSNFIITEFEKNYSIRPKYLIPLGVDLNKKPNTLNRNIDLLAVGSLIPLKRYDLFIEIVSTIQLKLPNINAILCGKGVEEVKLKRLTSNLSLNENIKIIGEKPHPEILHLMQHTKVFLHTSSYEGFGAVCIEALHAGAHVISFCKPMQENIKHWHIVDTKEEMINKAMELLTNPNLKHIPISPYTMANTATKLIKLFNYSELAIELIQPAIASNESVDL